MNILFISFSKRTGPKHLDPSTRYRCYHMAEEMRLLGHVADVCHVQDVQPEFVERYDVFVFHRPRGGRWFFELRTIIAAVGKPAVADFDDLVFSEEAAEASPQYLGKRASLSAVRKQHRSYANALRTFGRVTVSTEPLADHVRKLLPGADVFVIPNGLSARWVRQGVAFGHCRTEPEQVIGYFPGTSSHNHDFPVVAGALKRFLARRPDVRLRVVGPLRFSRSGFRPGQVEQRNPVPYYSLPEEIRACRVTIAPLAETTFNACKSGLKFFESAVWGVPVIGSPIPDMMRHESGGALLPQSEEEWLGAMETIFDEQGPEKRSARGQAHVLEKCMAAPSALRLLRWLQEVQRG